MSTYPTSYKTLELNRGSICIVCKPSAIETVRSYRFEYEYVGDRGV